MINTSLIDDYGRRMRKLRVSLLDACNMRCTYCMPASATFSRMHDLLSPEEIHSIVGNLISLGIQEVRLTGGEPTLRAELVEIAERLSRLEMKSLGITTNGLELEKFLPDLARTKLSSVNVSLDSLNPHLFQTLTRSSGLEKVLKSIDKAIELGFKVKINTVLMNQNKHEIPAFIEFARARGIEVRFLELMKIGVAIDFFEDEFIPAGHGVHALRSLYKLKELPVPEDSTAFIYQLDNGARVGFIASETIPFCGSCSRLRLDSKGALRSCLMKEDKESLRGLPLESYPQVIKQVLKQKPYVRVEKVSQPMYQIGG